MKLTYDEAAMTRRTLALHNALDVTLGQWQAWLEKPGVVDSIPSELEPVIVDVVVGLRGDSEDRDAAVRYVRALAQLTTDVLELLVREVTR